MALAIAGSVADGPVRVRQADNVETSFPGFAGLMQSLGMSIREERDL
jgi:3-phosphoshikimate 1-carboxyvinyltransferase